MSVILHPKCEATRGDGLSCQNRGRFMLAGKRVCQLKSHQRQFGDPVLAVHIRELAASRSDDDPKHISTVATKMHKDLTMSKTTKTTTLIGTILSNDEVDFSQKLLDLLLELLKPANSNLVINMTYHKVEDFVTRTGDRVHNEKISTRQIFPCFVYPQPMTGGLTMQGFDFGRSKGFRNFSFRFITKVEVVDAKRDYADLRGAVRLYPGAYDLFFEKGLSHQAPVPVKVAADATEVIDDKLARGYVLSRPTYVVGPDARLPKDSPHRKRIFVVTE